MEITFNKLSSISNKNIYTKIIEELVLLKVDNPLLVLVNKKIYVL